ncbi:putative mitochondrial CAAX prenyl protease 1, putative,metallo-peptidase, Clan M-, Family M48 [Leptomonas pyrrhocoris]|uniref:CAAX prenyl protease n=1 Tax=Leptomonas pyrrhocoris TaxID=157538 RepID=A0A0M9FPU8_LEPPY|nr:putative mitochondrial CAAX prenyl protease 1, putative,metallo-peptidase, Clan M-, Family M48 [Leptomonas pyrrhocoris]KPA73557.1 putative mitochondrial CAAX prenyl protease 1, putative,metallo-peptidase, Clan M-, Family M48 [Leptomonas pyrrhocoris]|eukprot:XP_015651996.1 putative mitochondrial CAAX prenyl protease 1, putative,metallo-peptidase, Clan M-, Family M48 [Leptomonas pyrrhocoris]
MSAFSPFLQAATISTNAIGFWDAYLLFRQRRSYNTTEIPAYFKEKVTEEEFDKAQAYGRDSTSFSLLEHVKGLVLSNVELLLRVPARFYYYVAKRTGLTVGSFAHNYTCAVAADVVSIVLDTPFSYYDTFYLEERHGFNKTTKMEFVKDIIKSFLLRIILLYPVQTALIQFVVRQFGERFPIYFFGGMTVLMFTFMVIYPNFIMPLFNKFTPIDKESPLKKKIETLCATVHFPLKKVFVVDGSRRSHHSNAYFYGFGKNKCIVLYDTLLEQMKESDEPILAVLCHELGHWKHWHMYINLSIALAQLLGISYGAGAAVFNPRVYEAFGFHHTDPVVGMYLFLEVFFQPISALMGHVSCYISRQHEFQADRFAVSQGYGGPMKKALLVMTKENKSAITPDPLYSAMTYTHPPMLERLEALDVEMKKQK